MPTTTADDFVSQDAPAFPMRSEACYPCRERKVKCDTITGGVPCSRCVESSRPDECFVPPRQKRRITRRGRIPRTTTGNDASGGFLETPRISQSRREHAIENQTVQPDIASIASPVFPQPLTPNDTGNNVVTEVPHFDEPENISYVASENEDSILSHVCQQIASRPSPTRIPFKPHLWSEAIEYQNALNATGILGEVLAQHQKSNRVIQINFARSAPTPHGVNTTGPKSRRELELQGLDEHDISYLSAKGAFKLPSSEVCEEFIDLYFHFAYPYAPVLDRVQLLLQHSRQDYSLFVMHSLLANAVPCAGADLIRRAGFADHETALKTFYKRAVLLYDFNCEKSQLFLLQGSLLLGIQWVSHVADKDYRYWMSTAVRIAMRMGLHRRHIEDELEPTFYKLLKRIWSVIWIRDVLMITTGLDNGRWVADDCDTLELTEDDWSEEHSMVPDDLVRKLPPITTCQRQVFIHLSKLARIGRVAHKSVLSQQAPSIDLGQARKVLEAIMSWRRTLPIHLHLDSVDSWTTDGMWIIVLMTWSSRIECHIHRILWQSAEYKGEDCKTVRQKLQNAVFDLDAVIKRAVLHGICRFLPLSVSTSAATTVALAIELLLDPAVTSGEKLVCQGAIRTGVAFLLETQETWTTLRALLKLFAWVIANKGLHFESGLEELNHTPVDTEQPSWWAHEMTSSAERVPAGVGGVLNLCGNVDPVLFETDPYSELSDWADLALLKKI